MIAKLAILLALLTAAFAGGFSWGHLRGVNAQAHATHQDIEDAIAARDEARRALGVAMRSMDALRTQSARALADATATLATRDADIAALRAAAQKRTTEITGATHETPSCADLARMPLCAAIADRLWPAPAASGPDAPAH